MVTIEKINRAYEIKKSGYVLNDTFITHYIETEKEFIKGIEDLCNTIGAENIITVQFLNGERNEIDGCILTYKE